MGLLLVVHIHISFIYRTRCTDLVVDSVVDAKDECVQNFSRIIFCNERLLEIWKKTLMWILRWWTLTFEG
jgi:hypothetical protein